MNFRNVQASKDTGSPSSRCEWSLFCASVQRVKRDMFAAEFDYAKRDYRLAAYRGVVLQRFEFMKVCIGEKR